MLCILASGWTLAVVFSPPVSSLSIARRHRPLRSATRPWGQPALTCSGECQLARDKLYHRSLSMARKMQQNSGRTTCHLERSTKWHAVCPFFAWGNFDVSAESRQVCLLVWSSGRRNSTHRLWAQRHCRGEQCRGYAYTLTIDKSKLRVGIQFWWGRHNYTCVFGKGWDTQHGNVAFTTAHAEERSKCSPGKHLSRYWKKSSITRSSHLRCAERRVAMYSHKRKIEQGPKKQTGVLFRKKMNIRGASRSSGLPHVTRRQSSRM